MTTELENIPEETSSALSLANIDDSIPFTVDEDLELANPEKTDSCSNDVESVQPQQDDAASEGGEHATTSTSKPTNRLMRYGFWAKILIGMVLLGFIVFAIVDSTTTGYVRSGFQSFLSWVQDNLAAGFFLFVLVYFVATVLFIPGALLTLGAGFIFSMSFDLGWGVLIGTVCVLIGASLGAIASFVLARFLLQEQVGKLSKKYATFEALETAIQGNGLKIFVLLRLSPIIPFNVINYLSGITSVTFRDYVISLLAIIPGTVLYVFLGSSTGSLANLSTSGQDPTVTIVVIVISAVFGILALWLTTRYARKELNRIVALREAQSTEIEDGEHDVEQNASDGDYSSSDDDHAADSTIKFWI